MVITSIYTMECICGFLNLPCGDRKQEIGPFHRFLKNVNPEILPDLNSE